MAHILILGAGLGGLGTALLLARDGHIVTVLERDPAHPPPPERAADAWDGWQRRGVNQFRLPHLMLPRWWAQLRAELPDAGDLLKASGALPYNTVEALPESRRGPMRAGDERFDTVTARRPVLEAVLSAAVDAAGVTVRRGVAVTGLATDGRGPVPRVTGVLTADGRTIAADLVVDCGGRRSALPAWLEAAGARRPVEERDDCGFVYYGRHFTAPGGGLPALQAYILQHYDSLSIIMLPGDHDTWSVVLTTDARDRPLRALRDPARWDATLARYPLAAQWGDAEPITGVDAMAGIEDRLRRFVVDGAPVATGVVAVGDAWACTSPSVGRGAAMALIHASVLRDVLHETGPEDHDALVRRFDQRTSEIVEPLFRATVWQDRHRLAEIGADIAGIPYRPDDARWSMGKALYAAGLVDPDLARAYVSIAAFIAQPAEVFAAPPTAERALALGGSAPQYPLPGPSRAQLLEGLR